ncbi:mitochondrial carrier [Gonapodya prolifera JEL478]|uniref:Mitochondrial carrier n=1 Tax=Gonapodya prolifera (strain JEL478) TaxID=1344416 RepID=A0A139AIF2_GONPJ|nr:mitochondrial carrier [Gonapodya prolifera JEL478]|eukprot:KXS16586.1 mitochondrial carrier [Gonapodya prolifera JEL478]
MSKSPTNQKTPLSVHFIAGGAAGACEAMCMHPLDTIKVRMQLRRNVPARSRGAAGAAGAAPVKAPGFIQTGVGIVQKDGPLGLYRGLAAVVSGIVPKMAIRFFSFEAYKDLLGRDPVTGKTGFWATFVSGLAAGVTESVLVVTPMDVLKIRVQAARASMTDPSEAAKYRNLFTAAYTIVKEEGPFALYKGVGFTALRQATNQAVNFTGYQYIKDFLLKTQDLDALPSWQHLLAGGFSGALGPLANNPIDTLKTRVQRQRILPGSELERMSSWQRTTTLVRDILKNEGWQAFYKGVTPRLLRVAPGQAITFMIYERVKKMITKADKDA